MVKKLERTAGNKMNLIAVLLFLAVLLVPVVSAGSNAVTSSTGKLIMNQMNALPLQIPIWYGYNQSNTLNAKSKPLTYDENSTACGNCDMNPIISWADTGYSLPKSPIYQPMSQVLPYKEPVPVPLDYNIASCGVCHIVVDPYAVPPNLTPVIPDRLWRDARIYL